MSRIAIWDSQNGTRNANLALKNNYEADAAPSASDDTSEGYEVGSTWFYGGASWVCTDATDGAAVWTPMGQGGTTQGQIAAPASSAAAGDGGDASLTGGAGGTTSGDGGSASLVGGAAQGGDGSGGSVVLQGGAGDGTGKDGAVYARGAASLKTQAAPAAKTVTAGITAAELVAGLITTTGATGPSVHQLPTGTEIDAELPSAEVDDSFDFCLLNTGTGASNDATITVNTDVTIVGNPTVGALTDATIISGSGLFRARKTADHVWVVYRLA